MEINLTAWKLQTERDHKREGETMADETEKGKTVIVRDIPKELKKKFALKCLDAEISQNKVMISLMQGYVDGKFKI
ncbi:MAG: hypothetical protein PHN44_10645 [Candidatus Marinimicrobia bacterium]|jgi:hypothetical protein|nr:hypothetical protein [Candidatus Neomarinimicrobiota bacterium]